MNEPIWIEREDCLAFHDYLLARFGGAGGIRDETALESALARPRNRFAYEHASCFALAAAYGYGIVSNHPFIDGNKRSGLMAAILFLELNDWVFTAPEEEAVLNTLALAAGEFTEAEYANWLEKSCRPQRRE